MALPFTPMKILKANDLVAIVSVHRVCGVIRLQVSAEEESAGLDIHEHSNIAYPDFVSASNELER